MTKNKNEEKSIQVPKQDVIKKEEMERTRERQCFVPKTDIYETEKEIVVIADVPGVDQKSIDITLEKNILTLNAFVDPSLLEGYKLEYTEYEPGDYQRNFRVSDEIDHDKIEARVTNGELHLRLPKSENSQVKKIPVVTG